jgi:hypothetical protein
MSRFPKLHTMISAHLIVLDFIHLITFGIKTNCEASNSMDNIKLNYTVFTQLFSLFLYFTLVRHVSED